MILKNGYIVIDNKLVKKDIEIVKDIIFIFVGYSKV